MTDKSDLTGNLADTNYSVHCYQNHNRSYETKFIRILDDEFPQEKYQPRKRDEDRTTIHYGQRKLHLSEVEFLTNVCNELPDKTFKNIVLIYAGAAPGIHIDLLSEMFPFIKFVLIDPAKFLIEPNSKIEIKQEFFNDEMALFLKEEYYDCIRLFISDIRLAGPGYGYNDDEIEEKVFEDMRSQQNWYNILEPFRSLLKFRLPYVENRNNNKNNKINYLDGKIYFQIWAPCSSSETRLYVGENASKKEYDCLKYENQMFRFNRVERAQCYKHPIEANGIDHCYDCYGEVFIFQNYINSLGKISSLNKSSIKTKSVSEFIGQLNEHLDASKKTVRLIWNKQEYEVKFTDIKYGVLIQDVCNKNSLIVSSNFESKWKFHKNQNSFHNFNIQNKSDYEKLHKRLDFKGVKRLSNNTSRFSNK